MKLEQFTYDLPESAISKVPAEPRDSAKCLISRNKTELIDSNVQNISEYIESGDLVIVNNTKVLPARIFIKRKSGLNGEVFLLNRIRDNVWEALVRPSAKIKINETVEVLKNSSHKKLEMVIGENISESTRQVELLSYSEDEFIHDAGQTPLPPYLGDVDIPIERYQTMFSKEEKSVAAPTAGLHFTQRVVDQLSEKKIDLCEITLHVGLGTFKPIQTDKVEDHVMHEEIYSVPSEVWDKVLETKKRGNKIVAVGTTSLRTLESVAITSQLSGSTDLFCYGDFDFKIVDYLFTNFHQSGSSLLVLLDAFIGSRWRELYDYALKNEYRFLSFGDSMFVGKR
ncbi:MAG: tRNA preQ1(34) S-adenosylmethionine ribosyltransferase-isomerase QueA [Acidimicrobiia bacterium]